MTDFTEALNVKVDEIEKPPLPPQGHYVMQVGQKIVYGEASSNKDGTQREWDTVEFSMKGVEPTQDVDPEALENFGGASAINLRNSFMFEKGDTPEIKAAFDRTLYQCKRFIEEHLGIDTAGMSLKEAIEQAKGAQCIGEVKYRPDPRDPENMFAELGRTAPLS